VHRVARSVVALAVSIVTAAALVSPSAADGLGGAAVDNSGIDYGVLVGDRNGSGANSGRGSSGNGPVCTFRLMGGPEQFSVYDTDGTLIEVEQGGAWYEKTCNGVFYGAVYLQGAPDAADPAEVAAGVMRRMTIPLPDVAMSPTGDQVVNLPSWFWVPNWETLSGTATVGGVTVQVSAQPTSGRWTFGDGTQLTCAPGIPWALGINASQACIHTWTRSSASQPGESYQLDVSVTWSASYSVAGGAGGGVLAPLTRTATVPVRVAEVQALNDRVGG